MGKLMSQEFRCYLKSIAHYQTSCVTEVDPGATHSLLWAISPPLVLYTAFQLTECIGVCRGVIKYEKRQVFITRLRTLSVHNILYIRKSNADRNWAEEWDQLRTSRRGLKGYRLQSNSLLKSQNNKFNLQTKVSYVTPCQLFSLKYLPYPLWFQTSLLWTVVNVKKHETNKRSVLRVFYSGIIILMTFHEHIQWRNVLNEGSATHVTMFRQKGSILLFFKIVHSLWEI